MNRWMVLAAASLLLARQAPAAMSVPLPAGCLHKTELPRGELEKLGRFFVLGDGYGEWTKMDCYPRPIAPEALATSVSSGVLGFVTSIGAGDVYVFDPGEAWLADCKRSSTAVAGSEPVTGSDVAELRRAIAASPTLAGADIREIGFAKGSTRDERPLYALYLGTRESAVFLQCFDDLNAVVERVADEISRRVR